MRQAQQAGGRNDETGTPVDRRTLAVFGGLMLAMLVATLDTQIVATALPSIARNLGGIGQFAWVSTAYLLTLSVSTLLAGKLGDLLGRKPVLLAAIGIFLAGSAACGAAGSMSELIAFRAIQGIGGGGITVTVFAVLGDLFEPRQRARFQGYSMAVFAVSSVTGPLIGGLITDHLGWRWVFYVNLPVGLVAAAITTRLLTRTAAPAASGTRIRIDYAGITVLAAAITCLVLLANWAGTRYAWTSATIAGLALAAVSLLAAFSVIERRAAEPVIPPRLLRESTVAISTIVAFAAGFVGLGALNYLSLFLQRVTGTSAQDAGLLLLPLTAGLLVASVTAGQLISRTGRYRRYPAASMAVAAVATYLLSTMDADTSLVIAAIFLGILGLGIGLSQNVVVLAAQASAPPHQLGAATSVVTFARILGASFGIAAFGAVLNHGLAASSGRASPAAYAHALSGVFLTAIPVLLAGLAVSLLLKNVPLRQRGGTPGTSRTPDAARSRAG
jgi:EmrB/QacA subfamily drug resistance transporter